MLEKKAVHGNVIADNVPWEVWVEEYAEAFTEWEEGRVIKLSPVTEDHDGLFRFFIILLEFFLDQTGLGIVRSAPFVMKIRPGAPGREPDLQIVLKERSEIVQETMVAGAADIVIEIVSKESQQRDLVEKYEEYEAGGVKEYWLIHPLRKQADFYLLGDDGLYKRIELHNGVFRSAKLTDFSLNTAQLWNDDLLQDDDQIRALVEAMLNKEA
jgi:Uma2 family endonuclease